MQPHQSGVDIEGVSLGRLTLVTTDMNDQTSISGFLRRHWPFFVLLILGGLGYADLRGQLTGMQSRLDSRVQAPIPSNAPSLAASAVPGVGQRDPGTGVGRGAMPTKLNIPSQVDLVDDEWKCQGSMPDDVASEVVEQNDNGVLDCIESMLVRSPSAQGTLTIQIKIDAAGKVIATRSSGLRPGAP